MTNSMSTVVDSRDVRRIAVLKKVPLKAVYDEALKNFTP